MDEPMFPILGDPIIKALPWSVMTPHEEQARRNHGGQTLKRLAQRGGLGIEEAYCVLKDAEYPRGKFNQDVVRVSLMRMVHDAKLTAREEAP